eukprot:801372-Pelagomonas_calceolata.AAC.1
MEKHWLRRAVNPLPSTTKLQKKILMGIWRVTASTRIQNLAVRLLLSIERLAVTSLLAYMTEWA